MRKPSNAERPPEHALEMARICWTLHDTARTNAMINTALDMGIEGPQIAMDTTLATFWTSDAAAAAHALWSVYAAMQLPDLKKEL